VLSVLLIILIIFSFAVPLYCYEKEIKELSEKIANQVESSHKKAIAVVDLIDLQGNTTELGRFLAEEISVELMSAGKKFEIIDRNHLKSIMKEHKFSMSGLVDPNTVKKLGQIAGVDAIVTGTVTAFGDSIRVTCKVIATDTARIIGGSRTDIAKTKTINDLLGSEIQEGSEKSQKEKKRASAENTQTSSTQQSPVYRVSPVSWAGTQHDDLTRELSDSISGIPFAKVIVGGDPNPRERLVSVTISRLSDRIVANPEYAGAAMAQQFFGNLLAGALANTPKNLIEINATITVVVNDNSGGKLSESAEVIYRTDGKKDVNLARKRGMSEALTDASGRLVVRINGGIPPKQTTRIIDDYPKSQSGSQDR
jgi:TolB-like protein